MTREETDLCLLRIGSTRDGAALLDLLQDELLGVSGPGIEDGALRHREGRRNFAAELIGRLSPPDTGTSSGRTDADSTDASSGSRRSAGSGRSGPRRRVPPTNPRDFPKR